ncbi:hypothetical protein ACVL5V_005554 [Bradyrhizobium ottawaense]
MSALVDLPTDPRFIDLTGQRFGIQVVVSYAGRNAGRKHLWNCLCDCGNRTISQRQPLVNGDSKSCGCRKSEASRVAATKHGHTTRKSVSRTYKSWASMLERCGNPKAKSYSRYGGRGISVCPEWAYSFESFLADMGERPPGKTLDREDCNGNYEPGNCRWATVKEQNNNRRDNNLELRRSGLPKSTFYRRLRAALAETVSK